MGVGADDLRWMQYALTLAERARAMNEVPIGAVVVQDGAILGEGWNQPIALHDPSAHAEMLALRAAARQINNYRLGAVTLYVTLEPCTMCAGAMVHARIARLVYGARDSLAGAVGSASNVFTTPGLNHRPEVQGGVLESECAQLLREFFKARRRPTTD